MNNGKETEYEYRNSRIYKVSEEGKTLFGTLIRIMITTKETDKVEFVDDKYMLKD